MDESIKMPDTIQLGRWSFNVINLKDYDIYSQYIKNSECPASLWTSNFPLLWAISQSPARKTLWKVIDDMLVTFSYLRSGTLYMTCLPFGDGSPEKMGNVVYECLRYCYHWNHNSIYSSVVKALNMDQLEYMQKDPEFDRYYKVVSLVGKEKCFSIPNLITLSGKQFETIRRKIRKFSKSHPNAVVRYYRPEDFEAVMKLGDYWSQTSGQKYSHVFDGVYFPEIIKHCSKLHHRVLVVEEEGRIIGMVSGGELPTGQSWWCLSKYMNDYDGLSEFLIIELAREINRVNPNIELMNAGSDLGPGGLRFFKERFRPVLDLRKFEMGLR